MATVITSLATVLPVIGKTVVSWLWGGFKNIEATDYSNVVLSILLYAGIGFLDVTVNISLYVYNYLINNVRMLYTTTQSAGLLFKQSYKTTLLFCKNSFFSRLYPLNTKNRSYFNWSHKGNKINRLSCLSNGHMLNNKFQRLNARNLMWLIGFVEGDGSFSVNKNGKYVKYEFCIELGLRDIQLLYKIKFMLNDYGSITTRKRGTVELARFKISSKPILKDLIIPILKDLIIPIFDEYNMLTSKHYDNPNFRTCLLQNYVYSDTLPAYIRPSVTPINKVEDILSLPYFDNWLVGFIEAEATFSTFQPTGDSNKTALFGVCQTNGLQIITAIKVRLNLKTNPYLDTAGNTHSYVINTTSKHGVQNVISFLKDTPVKLKGYKREQYLKWLHEMRTNNKYRSLNIPMDY